MVIHVQRWKEQGIMLTSTLTCNYVHNHSTQPELSAVFGVTIFYILALLNNHHMAQLS